MKVVTDNRKNKIKVYKKTNLKEFVPNIRDSNLFEHSTDPMENVDIRFQFKTPSRYLTKEKKNGDSFGFINKLICGDAIEIMQGMPATSVDLTVTSPPYDELRNYNGYDFDFEAMAKGLYKVTKKGGVVALPPGIGF